MKKIIQIILRRCFYPFFSFAGYCNAKKEIDKKRFAAYGKMGIVIIFGVFFSIFFVPNIWLQLIFSALCCYLYYCVGRRQMTLLRILAAEKQYK